jgi:hypothetical protein
MRMTMPPTMIPICSNKPKMQMPGPDAANLLRARLFILFTINTAG